MLDVTGRLLMSCHWLFPERVFGCRTTICLRHVVFPSKINIINILVMRDLLTLLTYENYKLDTYYLLKYKSFDTDVFVT